MLKIETLKLRKVQLIKAEKMGKFSIGYFTVILVDKAEKRAFEVTSRTYHKLDSEVVEKDFEVFMLPAEERRIPGWMLEEIECLLEEK